MGTYVGYRTNALLMRRNTKYGLAAWNVVYPVSYEVHSYKVHSYKVVVRRCLVSKGAIAKCAISKCIGRKCMIVRRAVVC